MTFTNSHPFCATGAGPGERKVWGHELPVLRKGSMEHMLSVGHLEQGKGLSPDAAKQRNKVRGNIVDGSENSRKKQTYLINQILKAQRREVHRAPTVVKVRGPTNTPQIKEPYTDRLESQGVRKIQRQLGGKPHNDIVFSSQCDRLASSMSEP
jgi:hypothetical protein